MCVSNKMKAQCVMKRNYLSEAHAEKAVLRYSAKFGKRWSYKCLKCKHYHLTSTDPQIFIDKQKETAEWFEYFGLTED